MSDDQGNVLSSMVVGIRNVFKLACECCLDHTCQISIVAFNAQRNFRFNDFGSLLPAFRSKSGMVDVAYLSCNINFSSVWPFGISVSSHHDI